MKWLISCLFVVISTCIKEPITKNFIQFNETACFTYEIKPFSSVLVFKNFTCGLEGCIKKCNYDDNCGYAIWNGVDCAITVDVQETDDVKKGIVVYGLRIPTFYPRRCMGLLPRKICNDVVGCAWKRGRIGRDDLCGRIC